MRATVSHYEIPAHDPERAARFYREAFGWSVEPLAWERPYFKIRGSAVPSELGREGIDGGLTEAGGGLEHPLLIIHVEGATLEHALARIVAAGGKVDRPAARVGEMGWWARFRDSEGNLLGLWQHASWPRDEPRRSGQASRRRPDGATPSASPPPECHQVSPAASV